MSRINMLMSMNPKIWECQKVPWNPSTPIQPQPSAQPDPSRMHMRQLGACVLNQMRMAFARTRRIYDFLSKYEARCSTDNGRQTLRTKRNDKSNIVWYEQKFHVLQSKIEAKPRSHSWYNPTVPWLNTPDPNHPCAVWHTKWDPEVHPLQCSPHVFLPSQLADQSFRSKTGRISEEIGHFAHLGVTQVPEVTQKQRARGNQWEWQN